MTPQEAVKIRAAMRKGLAQVAMRLHLVKQEDDEQFPEDYRRKRQEQRDDLIREWTMIEGRYDAEMRQWQQQAAREAARLRAAQPIGSPAEESRRVAENMEIASLAEPLIGAGHRQIDARLLSEARKFLSLDLPDRARVYLEAAKRAGVDDMTLGKALDDAYDRTVPARRQAKAIEQVAVDQGDLLALDRASLRLVHGVGDQVRASTTAKVLLSRRGTETPAGMLTASHGASHIATTHIEDGQE